MQWGRIFPTAAHVSMGHVFKPSGFDVRKLRCAGVEISMNPSELFDKTFIGLQRGEWKDISLRPFPDRFRLMF